MCGKVLAAPFSRVRSPKVGHRASVEPLPHLTNPLETFGNQRKRLEDEQPGTSSIIEIALATKNLRQSPAYRPATRDDH